MRALLMPVGEDRYAIAMGSVQEVVARPRPAAVPTTPASVIGLFNLRGAVIPLFDSGTLLGLEPLGDAPFCVVVRTALGPAGLLASGAPESVELGDPVAAAAHPAGLGGYAAGERLAVLIDVETLLVPTHTDVRSS